MAPTTAREWIDLVLDPGWTLLFEDVVSGDPLNFPGYAEQLRAAREKTGCSESVLVAEGAVNGLETIAISFEFGFLGGSMGVAAGERICRAFERAAEKRLQVIALTASGGARMQEGMLALAQMPATLIARDKLKAEHKPFIAYLRNPTTGGVYASFASSADFVWAEPGATIGFAGPRVAEVVTGEDLPSDSHSAESAFKAGRVDEIVSPDKLRSQLLAAFRPAHFGYGPMSQTVPQSPFLEALEERAAWNEVSLAREADRPTGAAYIEGDTRLRRGGLDPTITISWTPWISFGRPLVIAQDRRAGSGRTNPYGFRRIRRAIQLAIDLDTPIVTLIDTPGADPSADSERDGIAAEISLTFEALLAAPVPTVAVVVGEGGSGGALALAACDQLLVMEHAIFSVIRPEGAAAILRRDDVEAVARDLHLTARDLFVEGLADKIIREPGEGAHEDPNAAIEIVHLALNQAVQQLRVPGTAIPSARRFDRWRVHR